MRSNDTLGVPPHSTGLASCNKSVTSFMLIKVFSVLSMFLMLSTLPPCMGVLEEEGGATCRLPGLVTEQAVEFPVIMNSRGGGGGGVSTPPTHTPGYKPDVK